MDFATTVLENKLHELEHDKQKYQQGIVQCDIQIQLVKDLLSSINEKTSTIKKEKISKELRKNSLKDLFTDEKDVKRVNVFLEFQAKCPKETIYMNARKIIPSLETHIYRKKLWSSWREFLDDFQRWIKREPPWDKILVKEPPENLI